MIIFNLTTLHLWGRTLSKYPQTRVFSYPDDGYIKTKWSVTLQVLSGLKYVLKKDAGLKFNVSKMVILTKVITQQVVFDTSLNIITPTPSLTDLNGNVSLVSFVPGGFVGIGVPIDTQTFVQKFVVKTCRVIIDDVEKLDSIQDGFIHYQLLRFYQDTRLQYLNSHIFLDKN